MEDIADLKSVILWVQIPLSSYFSIILLDSLMTILVNVLH